MRAPLWTMTPLPTRGAEHAGTGGDRAVAADLDVRADHGARADARALADLGIRTDHGHWLDDDVVSNLALGSTKAAGEIALAPDVTVAGRMASGCSSAAAVAKAACGLEEMITGMCAGMIDCIDASQMIGGRMAGCQLIAVLAGRECTNVALAGTIDRRNGSHDLVRERIISQLRPKMSCQPSQADTLMGRKKAIRFHQQQLQNGI